MATASSLARTAPWDLRARCVLELRRRRVDNPTKSLPELYAFDPAGYIRDRLGWEPWSGTAGNPGQLEVLEAYTLALRQQVERQAFEHGELTEDQLQHWKPGAAIQNWIRIEAGHTVGKCVQADELLTLADGRRVRAGNLIDQNFNLLTLVDGRPAPVRARAAFNACEPVFRVTTDTGKRVVRNARHPLWATTPTFRSGRRPAVPSGSWRGAAALEPGMLVAVAEELPAFGDASGLTDVEVKLLAYLIGDGGYTGRLISFSQQDNAQLAEFRACAEAYGCAVDQISTYDWKVVGAGRRHMQYNPVMELLRRTGLMGCHSRDKRIPGAVFTLDQGRQRLFLSRLFSTDGWASLSKGGSAEIGFCSASEGLVADLQELLLRFGVHGRIAERSTSAAWTLYVRDKCDIMRFIEEVGIYGKESAVERVRAAARPTRDRKAVAIKQRPDRPRWCHKNAPGGTRWERVVSVECVGMDPTVAIEVPGHHTYLTSFWEHNTKLAAGITSHFHDCFVPSIGYTFAPGWDQINDLLWKEIRADREGKGLPGRVYEGSPEMRRSAQHFVKGRATNNAKGTGTERIQGQHGQFLLFVLDEAEGIADFVWDAMDSMTSGGVVIVLMLANPKTRTSRFHKTRTQSNVRSFRISCLDHPNVLQGREVVPGAVRRDWVERNIEKLCEVVPSHDPDEMTFTVTYPVHARGKEHPAGTIFRPDPNFMWRVLGRAPVNLADNTFVPVGRYEAAKARSPEPAEAWKARLGVDVARFGSDLGTLYVRWAGRAWRWARFARKDTNAYARGVKDCAKWLASQGVTSLQVRVDGGGGFGGGVVDKIAPDLDLQQGFRDFVVLEVHFNGTPHDDEAYADLVTEMYGEAAETLKGLALVDPPETLEADLTERTFGWVNRKARDVKKLTPKDKFRTDTGRSPDDGDGFVLAVAPDFLFEGRGALDPYISQSHYTG